MAPKGGSAAGALTALPTKSLSNLLGSMKSAGKSIGSFTSQTLTSAKTQIKSLLTGTTDTAKSFKNRFSKITGYSPKKGTGVGDAELEVERLPGIKRGPDDLPTKNPPELYDGYEFSTDADGVLTVKPKQGFKFDPNNPDGPARPIGQNGGSPGVPTSTNKNFDTPVNDTDFQKQLDDLKKTNKELGDKVSELNLKKTDLDDTITALKKSPPEVQAKADGLFTAKNAAIAAGLMVYFAHKKQKEEAEENRKKCKELCKPEGFEYWKAGTVQIAQLSDTTIEGSPQLFKDACGDDNTCWNDPDAEISTVTCNEQTATASNCETICNTHCNEAYPIPTVMDTLEGIKNGDIPLGDAIDGALDTAEDIVKEVSDPFLKRFEDMFSFLGEAGKYVVWFFIGLLALIFLFIFIKYGIIPMMKKGSASAGGSRGQNAQVVRPQPTPGYTDYLVNKNMSKN